MGQELKVEEYVLKSSVLKAAFLELVMTHATAGGDFCKQEIETLCDTCVSPLQKRNNASPALRSKFGVL